MEEIFGRKGLIARHHPDYDYRPGQLAMASAVADALEERHHLLVEAGTGTGKTLAYLVPAALSGLRVVVSTGTKTLQDQIFYKDIPLLETVMERPIRAAYLKGRNNYLCRLKLETLHAEGLFSMRELRSFKEILDWAEQTETGDVNEWLRYFGALPEDEE